MNKLAAPYHAYYSWIRRHWGMTVQAQPKGQPVNRLRALLASRLGQLAEHYLIVFAAAASMTALASSQRLDGVHGVHAVGDALIGVGAAALKAGYDAVRQLAIPALAAWFASRGYPTPPQPAKPKADAKS